MAVWKVPDFDKFLSLFPIVWPSTGQQSVLLKHIPLPQYTILVAWVSKPYQIDILVPEMPTFSDCGLSYLAGCLQLYKVLSSKTTGTSHQPGDRGLGHLLLL